MQKGFTVTRGQLGEVARRTPGAEGRWDVVFPGNEGLVACTPAQLSRTYEARDLHTDCDAWAARGECDINPNFMRTSCERACAAHAAFRASLVGLPPAPAPPSEGEVKQAEELSVPFTARASEGDGVPKKTKKKKKKKQDA